MGTDIRSTICKEQKDCEVHAEDFAPWSYNLHYITTAEPWIYSHHRHFGCFELVYTITGTVEHRLEGNWREFSSGDLLAVGEEDYHTIRGAQFSYANLIIPTRFWEERMIDLGIGDPLGSPASCRGKTVRIPPERRLLYRDLFDKLYHAQQSSYGERLIRRFLGILVYEAYWVDFPMETGIDSGSKAVPGWWRDLVRTIESEGSIPSSPSEMADWAGRSREHAARVCRRVTGLSPSTWLNGLRLEKAALHLRKSNRDIADIAYELGFGSLEHFYRLFRREFGAPPGRYRRENGDVS